MARHTLQDLQELQALPLNLKIRLTQQRIREWVNHFGVDGVYVSFSGGKDSTVLMDICREMFPNIKAMFADVPTQYPELREFVKTYDNVDITRPKINFVDVCEKYGFPLISKEVSHRMSDWYSAKDRGGQSYVDRQFDGTYVTKNGKTPMIKMQKYAFLKEAPFRISHKCCNHLKKNPSKEYRKKTGRVPITAQMASESLLRTKSWLEHSCNAFDSKEKISNPMSFWTEQDVLLYIRSHNLPICSVYGEVVTDDEEMGQIDFMQYTGLELFDRGNQPLHCTGCQRTGCVCCGFGAHTPGDTRSIPHNKLLGRLLPIYRVAGQHREE